MTTSTEPSTRTGYQGTEKLLWGIVLAVLTFWLFATTAGTVSPAIMADVNSDGVQHVNAQSMNLAVSITALFSGLFIVLMGGLADKVGRVKITLLGIVANVTGSILLLLATGGLALPFLLVGRALQGFAAACIMPASMALVKSYWDGPARQRAVSMWSIGSWGGSGLAALFGGFVVNYVGWRGIFATSIVISIISFAMIWGTPESKVEADEQKKGFDILGLILFIIGTLALMIVLLFGSDLGWGSPLVLGLALVGVLAFAIFVYWELRHDNPFVDFKLFRNTTFTGATISNFLINTTMGMLFVSQQLIQIAGAKADGSPYSAWDAGLLTIGYGVFIIAFIRVGEKLLQRFGPRKPMIWGAMIAIGSCLLLMATNVYIGQYVILAAIAYCLFGLGLAFYATPSTDAALSNLPAAQVGAGSGIYKMASSLGSAIGTAVSLAVFTGMANIDGQIMGSVIEMSGRVDNIPLRQAAMVALGVNLVFLLLAILSVTVTVPKGGGSKDKGKVAESAAPAPQAAPDEAKADIINRLSTLSLHELEDIERQVLLNRLGAELDTNELRTLEKSHRS